MRNALLAIAVATALAVAGCGGSSKKSSGGASTGSTPAPAATGGVVKVSMENIKFVPMTVNVKVSQKIVWTNNDPVAHTVTATGGAKFDSGSVNSGGTYSFTPKQAGTIQYVCTIHSSQTGTIVVQ